MITEARSKLSARAKPKASEAGAAESKTTSSPGGHSAVCEASVGGGVVKSRKFQE